MSRIRLLLSTVLLLAAATQAQAQLFLPGTEPQTGIGLGVVYGSNVIDAGTSGVGIQAYYLPNENVRFQVDSKFYFVSHSLYKSVRALEWSINGLYKVAEVSSIDMYALFGVNNSFLRYGSSVQEETGRPIDIGDSMRSPGINMGMSLEASVGDFVLYLDPVFTLGGFGQIFEGDPLAGIGQFTVSTGLRIFF